jgi:hypothetical protein
VTSSSNQWRADSQERYATITDRNRKRLVQLEEISSRSPWAKSYPPIRPRDLSALLLNAFRVSSGGANNAAVGASGFAEQIASATAQALSDPSQPKTAEAIEFAILEVRRLRGLLDPARRVAYPWAASGPDPNLTVEEHTTIETILREWLLDALAEFAS